MNFNKVYGSPEFPTIPGDELAILAESARRSSIQYHTLQGYISENRVIRYLCDLAGVTRVTKIPDYAEGHGGDVSFKYRNNVWSVEIKTVTIKDNGVGSVSIKPTRKSDVVQAYRRGHFDLLAVAITNRGENGLLFVHTDALPNHKVNPLFLQGSLTIKEVNDFFPFSYSLGKALAKPSG